MIRFFILTNLFLLSLLSSCDPTFYYENGVTWRIVNGTKSVVEIHLVEKNGLKYVYSRSLQSDDAVLIDRKETNNCEFSFVSEKFESIVVVREDRDSVNIDSLFFDKSNWNMEIKNGDEVYDKPFTSEYEFWYDYTFVITDSMLKKE